MYLSQVVIKVCMLFTDWPTFWKSAAKYFCITAYIVYINERKVSAAVSYGQTLEWPDQEKPSAAAKPMGIQSNKQPNSMNKTANNLFNKQGSIQKRRKSKPVLNG